MLSILLLTPTTRPLGIFLLSVVALVLIVAGITAFIESDTWKGRAVAAVLSVAGLAVAALTVVRLVQYLY